MPPTVKDSAIPVNAPPNRPAPPNAPAPDQIRQQPVCLEVPVTVHGARTIEGSNKREPFSETTRTVLVFATGAVLRLAASVAPGQLLFLTNERTKKEIVCQVVKSKNYRSVSGYVELEFTEPVVGFWGMRFPGDRLGHGTPPASSNVPGPEVPAVRTQATSPIAPPFAETRSVPDPVPVPNVGTPLPFGNVSVVDLPRASDIKPAPPLPKVTLPPPPAAPPQVNPPAGRPSPDAPPKSAEGASESSAAPVASLDEILRHLKKEDKHDQTAAAPSLPATLKPEAVPPPPAARPVVPSPLPPAAITPERQPSSYSSSSPSLLGKDEEVPVPAWLTPAAYSGLNTPTRSAYHPPPAANPLTSLLENARSSPVADASKQHHEPTDAATHAEETLSAAAISAGSAEGEAPAFGERLPFAQEGAIETGKKSASRGLLYGCIAALVLVSVAGGAWYLRQNSRSSGSPAASLVTPSRPANAVAQPPAGRPSSAANMIPQPPASAASTSASVTVTLANSAAKNQPLAPAAVKPGQLSTTTTVPPAVPAENPAKKTALPQIRLSRPVVSRNTERAGGPDTDINLGNMPSAPVESEAAGLVAAHTTEPAAPKEEVPVGGQIKPARLISSVSPAYPQLARSQRIGGVVTIDALIEVNGRVSSMKVITGHPLLQQAAMDALRQWKYEPAILNDKAVPMHLTVKIQFRLQ